MNHRNNSFFPDCFPETVRKPGKEPSLLPFLPPLIGAGKERKVGHTPSGIPIRKGSPTALSGLQNARVLPVGGVREGGAHSGEITHSNTERHFHFTPQKLCL